MSKWQLLLQFYAERHCQQSLYICHPSCPDDNFWVTTFMTNYWKCLRRRLLPLTNLKTSFFLSKASYWGCPDDYFRLTNFWQIKTCFQSRRLRHPFFCQKFVTQVFSVYILDGLCVLLVFNFFTFHVSSLQQKNERYHHKIFFVNLLIKSWDNFRKIFCVRYHVSNMAAMCTHLSPDYFQSLLLKKL